MEWVNERDNLKTIKFVMTSVKLYKELKLLKHSQTGFVKY